MKFWRSPDDIFSEANPAFCIETRPISMLASLDVTREVDAKGESPYRPLFRIHQGLTGREAVRTRPGMYLGPWGYGMLQQCVAILVASYLARWNGVGGWVVITLGADGSCTIQDDGPGIVVYRTQREDGLPPLEDYFTLIDGPAQGRTNSPYNLMGPFGVGASCVNFVSARFSVVNTTEHPTRAYAVAYEKGITSEPLRQVGESPRSGTTISFTPDPECIRDDVDREQLPAFHFDRLVSFLEMTAMLRPGLRFDLIDERGGEYPVQRRTIVFPNGVADVCARDAAQFACVPPVPFIARGRWKAVFVDCAFTFRKKGRGEVSTYVNFGPTCEGGTHLAGLRAALTRALNQVGRARGWLPAGAPPLMWQQVTRQIVVTMAVEDPNPTFAGPTRRQLASRTAYIAVYRIVTAAMRRTLEERPEMARDLVHFLAKLPRPKISAAQRKRDLEDRAYAHGCHRGRNHIEKMPKGKP